MVSSTRCGPTQPSGASLIDTASRWALRRQHTTRAAPPPNTRHPCRLIRHPAVPAFVHLYLLLTYPRDACCLLSCATFIVTLETAGGPKPTRKHARFVGSLRGISCFVQFSSRSGSGPYTSNESSICLQLEGFIRNVYEH